MRDLLKAQNSLLARLAPAPAPKGSNGGKKRKRGKEDEVEKGRVRAPYAGDSGEEEEDAVEGAAAAVGEEGVGGE